MKKNKFIYLIIIFLTIIFLIISTLSFFHLCLIRTNVISDKFLNSNKSWVCEELQLTIYQGKTNEEIYNGFYREGKIIINDKEYQIILLFTVPGNYFEQSLSISINNEELTTILHANGRFNLSGKKFILDDIVWLDDWNTKGQSSHIKKAVLEEKT